MTDTLTSKERTEGPLWTPTTVVERMFRECGLSLAETFTLDIKILEGLLYDSLLWRQERAAQQRGSSDTLASPDEGFQARVYDWMAKCFQRPDSMLPVQRSFRFIEEALELGQASGTSREEALQLVDYVYGRPPGVISQEIGGVMVTLSGLATSFGLSMEYAGNAELTRCDENTEKIRAKDLAKPQRSPLPGAELKALASGGFVEVEPYLVGSQGKPLPHCDCDPDFGCKTLDPAKFICCLDEMERKAISQSEEVPRG